MNFEEEAFELKIGLDNFIPAVNRKINDCYENIKKLGKGGEHKVYQVRNKINNKTYACKRLSKLNIDDLPKFQNEIEILMKTDHPNIIKLYEIFESKNSFYLILEECLGGNLFSRIAKRIESNDLYSERDACGIIQQVLQAIEYCHNNGIAHGDLKPENILYLKEGNEENNPIKLVDFGLSLSLKSNKMLSNGLENRAFFSPEILSGKQDEKLDIWSSGVILYILLSGEPPFNGPNEKVIFSKIKKLKYDFNDDRWKNISNDAKDLISKILVPANQRLTASQALQHPWFNIIKDKEITFQKLNIGKNNYFKGYIESNRLKKIILFEIASKLEEDEIIDLKNLFMAFDKDNNGQIDLKEFEQGLSEIKANDIIKEKLKKLFNDIDADKNGKIDYTEFIASTLEKKIYLRKANLFEAFTALDTNNNGKITKNELMEILKVQPKQDKYITKLISLADKNGDGDIDYKEFIEMMGYTD